MSEQLALFPVEDVPSVGSVALRRRLEWIQAYKAYMQSPQWRAFREWAFAALGRRCARCGRIEALNVHHVTYDHFGRERLDDVEILCSQCHQKHHEARPRQPRIAA